MISYVCHNPFFSKQLQWPQLSRILQPASQGNTTSEWRNRLLHQNHLTRPQVIVAFPSNLPQLTSGEASNIPHRPHLSDAELALQATAMITTPSTAEITILKLMQKYSFSLQKLIELLRGIATTLSRSYTLDWLRSRKQIRCEFFEGEVYRYSSVGWLEAYSRRRWHRHIFNVTGSIARHSLPENLTRFTRFVITIWINYPAPQWRS